MDALSQALPSASARSSHATPVAHLRGLAAFLLEGRGPQLRRAPRNKLIGGDRRERRSWKARQAQMHRLRFISSSSVGQISVGQVVADNLRVGGLTI
jgi:hypothetical protein